ncbi:exosortase system-associated protein, TIGR04073 family [Luteolibacter sp. GHJ8]|jgi:putative exosortase-associated protein (TIGR04073 family)|uniref:Exosortase system-associated protein, TIGR04073 family n=1 Tax=Luteolibacter rhizosphaerae TaxID=2989719 RepID=A0ABT3G3G1_9BACT|nr:exosortase system-associated protein, TIGR04073 family [Luteolibacter rhizosphaerae]MCW1913760.1 exosortase system-associated protein, TIGR04073 family [Luteolibacter rhizosphaerae]
MKKLAVIATAMLALGGIAAADIQAPPGHAYTSTRKLGRGLGNILYGFMEIPEQIVRKTDDHGRKAGWSYGAVDGTSRALKRLGYGFYEVFTFTCPTYRGTFKPPYEKCGEDGRIEMNPTDGLSEFPPELGFETYFSHTRSQRW